MPIMLVRGSALDLSTLDDEALLAIIAAAYGKRSSDPALNGAVAALYDRYGRLVYTIAMHTTGDVETAEEITQDVFVRVCKNAHTYRPDKAKVSSWLVSITRHRAIDELRRRATRPENVQLEWPDEGDSESVAGFSAQEGPEKMVETAIQQQNIRLLLTTLPVDQRIVLNLAFFKGLSHSQIAQLLDEPLGTVKSRVRLAMQKLRERMIESGLIER
jgi:RNA polymerase sigma-70 factor, ECF subfamily